MRKFIQRAIDKFDRLDTSQVRELVSDIASDIHRLEVVMDSLTEAIIVADIRNRIITSNRAALRLLAFSTVDYQDRPAWEVIGDSDIAGFVRRTLEQEDSVQDREFALEAGGTTRLLSVSIFPLVNNGTIEGSIIHADDVTERRGREARLRRAESLASLSTLAAGVAHEIKNPLGSIGIHMQLIGRALRAKTDVNREEIQGYVRIVEEEIERLNRIVVDFLFAVRPMDTHLDRNDLNEVVHELLRFVGAELDETNITLIEELDPALPDLLLDVKYMKQALLNIVKNAMEAMPEGGTLRVATELRGDEAIIRVTDNGVGMSDEIVEKIFEPYFTAKQFGSGIGLTLVYKVIKEHNGDIAVISRERQGTTFTIALPVPQENRPLIESSDRSGRTTEEET